jgi:hypothetical protein
MSREKLVSMPFPAPRRLYFSPRCAILIVAEGEL